MIENIISLNEIKPGQYAEIEGMQINGAMRRRLHDIGLIEGVRVECVQKSPLGDPVAYLIKGALIALRNEEAEKIFVRG